MSASVSTRFSVNDCAGAPQAVLRGAAFDGSIIELADVDGEDEIIMQVGSCCVSYGKTELMERGRIVYMAEY